MILKLTPINAPLVLLEFFNSTNSLNFCSTLGNSIVPFRHLHDYFCGKWIFSSVVLQKIACKTSEQFRYSECFAILRTFQKFQKFLVKRLSRVSYVICRVVNCLVCQNLSQTLEVKKAMCPLATCSCRVIWHLRDTKCPPSIWLLFHMIEPLKRQQRRLTRLQWQMDKIGKENPCITWLCLF